MTISICVVKTAVNCKKHQAIERNVSEGNGKWYGQMGWHMGWKMAKKKNTQLHAE